VGPAAPRENKEGGPTKQSLNKMKIKELGWPKQTTPQNINITRSKMNTSNQTTSPHIMVELPNPLKESLNKIYQGLEGIAKYIVGVEEKTNEALQRVGGLEERMESAEEKLKQHEKRFDNIENEINNLREYVEGEFKKVDKRLNNVRGALDALANAISKIPISYEKWEEAEPGAPGAKLIITPEGPKWYKCIQTQDEAGNYDPIRDLLRRLGEYLQGI